MKIGRLDIARNEGGKGRAPSVNKKAGSAGNTKGPIIEAWERKRGNLRVADKEPTLFTAHYPRPSLIVLLHPVGVNASHSVMIHQLGRVYTLFTNKGGVAEPGRGTGHDAS